MPTPPKKIDFTRTRDLNKATQVKRIDRKRFYFDYVSEQWLPEKRRLAREMFKTNAHGKYWRRGDTILGRAEMLFRNAGIEHRGVLGTRTSHENWRRREKKRQRKAGNK